MRTLIQNGQIVTASDTYQADLLIEDGIIARIMRAPHDDVMAVDRVIDAAGKLVLPGGIDVHTHFDMPFGGTYSSDDFETGTRAAAMGGTTTVIDFAIQTRGHTLQEGFDTWMAKAEGKASIDYGFHLILSEVTPAVLAEMPRLVNQGVSSFKLFTAYPGVFMVGDGDIFRALQVAGGMGALIMMHAENGGVIDVLVAQALARGETAPKYHALTRPPAAEGEATHRVLALAEMASAPIYIVHLSAREALEAVKAARDRGQAAYAETCPQYLFLSYDNYEEPGFAGAQYVMSPPLRPRDHQEALWTGLRMDDLQVVSTDHCPFRMADQKVLGQDDFSKIPNGAPGVETRMSLMFDGGVRGGRISLERFVQVTAERPAKLFGLYPQKGTVAVGSDADLLIWDPDRAVTLSSATLHMRTDYSPYEGRVVHGVPDVVLSRGEVVAEQGEYRGHPGRGRYLARKPAPSQGTGPAGA
jgi:dihydropyrimidinase